MLPISRRIAAKIRNVTAVPAAGIVTKVGTNVPMILPMVLQAPSFPTVLPLSSRLETVQRTSDGVTVPRRNSGNTNRTMQARNAAQIRKFVFTVMTRSPVIATITYFPRTGIRAIHTPAIRILRNSRAGSGFLSAHLPPNTFPRAMAIMIVPMIMVQTIWEELKYGARRRLAPSSTAITAMPQKNSVRYRYILFSRILLFFINCPRHLMQVSHSQAHLRCFQPYTIVHAKSTFDSS